MIDEENKINTNNKGDMPLVTFALFAYNQEGYIRGAVEAALAQTYENLEIIISDDASPDRTFEIMDEVVAGYKGPHKIILNRNKSNRGIAEHVNKVFELSSGEIIIMAAGDDISVPERSKVVAEEFANHASDTMIVYSNGWETDERGNKIQKIGQVFSAKYPYDRKRLILGHPYLVGATKAWRRELMTIFGQMQSEIENEDDVLLYRAILCGRIAYTDKCLVNRRIVPGSLGGAVSGLLQERLRYYKRVSLISRQLLADIRKNGERYAEYVSIAKLKKDRSEFHYNQWQKPGNFFVALITAVKLRSRAILTQYVQACLCHKKNADSR